MRPSSLQLQHTEQSRRSLGLFDNNSTLCDHLLSHRTNGGWLQYMGTVWFIKMGRPKGRHYIPLLLHTSTVREIPDMNLREMRENLSVIQIRENLFPRNVKHRQSTKLNCLPCGMKFSREIVHVISISVCHRESRDSFFLCITYNQRQKC